MSNSRRKAVNVDVPEGITRRVITGFTELCEEYSGKLDPSLSSEDKFVYDYQLKSFLSKYVDENTLPAPERRHSAIVKWLSVERRNARTNERLVSSDPVLWTGSPGRDATGWEVLRQAKRNILRVIGTTPPEDLLQNGSFTGGASTSRKRRVQTLASKFKGALDATPECYEILKDQLALFETWNFYQPELSKPRLVKGNILFTVPKNAVIDRVACKEPDLNLFAQKAIGGFIRRRLRSRVKIDLNDQSINRDLARKASIDGMLATIDLSSASDSLSYELVSCLLPHKWFKLLDACRCRKTFIDGLSHVNEMFSSMGNGFTFELESLVFWAIARATCYLARIPGRVSVYGDDIIVPSRIAAALINTLGWMGFKTNVDKTFFKGSFRESCGGHYYRGVDVTPIYLRRPIKDVSDLILFLNQLRAWTIRLEADQYEFYTTTNRFVELWYGLARHVNRKLWGGYSTESRVQLASKGPQKLTLLQTSHRCVKLEKHYQIGMYLSRLCELNQADLIIQTTPGWKLEWDQEGQFSEFRVHTRDFVMRPCRVEPAVFGLVRPLFISEQ